MMKRTTWTVIALLLILGLFPLTGQAAPLKNLSWRAEYYDNSALSGQPRLVRYEDVLDHDWGSGSPSNDIPADHFSARWTVNRHFDRGTYLFVATVDDGIRVWFDGKLILDAWTTGSKENLKAKVYTETTGNHELQVAYFENTGQAMIKFDWFQLAGKDEIAGAWRGEYFRNRDLAGDPTLVRQDGKVDFDWNSGSPDPRIPRDNFSVRWTRSIYLDAGVYRLRIQHDDGMRVFVNDYQVYDSWFDQGVTYQTRRIELQTGYHAFRVEYYEHLSNAVARMTIDDDPGNYGPGDGETTPPGETIIVDNLSERFQWGGPLSNRYAGYGSCYGNDFYWTYNSTSTPVNSGKWRSNLNPGDYEVYAYIPAQNATTRSARYRIYHNGVQSDRVVNQNNYHGNWVSLGTYQFAGNEQEEYVILYDNTSESTGSTRVAFDAIKFVKR
ncbi:MAG: hypothetical protein JXM69_18285 [Anaerolineae bacterium]|nr:hypothetical protein [Anaerolineae bacterium]